MSDLPAVSSASKDPGEWLPIMDYAIKNNVSVSTLRRYIKAKKVEYRVEHGKYLIFDVQQEKALAPSAPVRAEHQDKNEVREMSAKLSKLEADLQQAQEEIAELKMLVALYEEQISPRRFDN